MEQGFLVTVPDGYAPGQVLRYRTPYTGENIYEVTIPDGAGPGSEIRVSLTIDARERERRRQEIDALMSNEVSLEEIINNRIKREKDKGDESQVGGRKLIKKSRKRKSKRKSKSKSRKHKSKSKSRKRKSHKKK